MSIANLSPAQLRQAANLKDQIAGLENKLAAILGSETKTAPVTVAKPTVKKGGMSPEGRARLVAAQKARWALIKAGKSSTAPKPAAKTSAAQPAKKKFTMSAAAKAKISAAAKARWAKVKAAKK